MKEQIKGWVARDKTEIGQAYFFHTSKPEFSKADKEFIPVVEGKCIIRLDEMILLNKLYGLKPGQCVKAVLTVKRIDDGI